MIDTLIKYTDKPTARAYFRTLRKELPDDRRAELDQALLANTINLSIFKDAKTLLCYYPVRGEPDILSIARHALKLEKKVAFPISHVEDRRLSFHIIGDLEDLTVGTYNIPEPSAELEEVVDFKDALCIVPALSFNKSGQRLGYGGGYYDRFLSHFDGISVGVAYSDFLTTNLPVEPHDATVDIIITENGGYFTYEQREQRKTKYSSVENN